MRHSLWWLLGQFVLVAASGTVIICAVVALWYGVSFAVLSAVGRVFPLRGTRWTPADHDPTGGAQWSLRKGRWTMTLDEAAQARARLSSREREARAETCAKHGHAWTGATGNEAQQYCGRCFLTRNG